MQRRNFVKSVGAALVASAIGTIPNIANATGVPYVIGIDFPYVPTNTTTGRNGNGGYLTVFMTNYPLFSDWGVGSHILIGGVEVAGYCCHAVPPWYSGIPSTAYAPDIIGVRVQVGNLGGAAYGTALDVDVIVGGVHATRNRIVGTTYYDLILGTDAPNKRPGFIADYHPLQVTPINGSVIYVDPVNGNDANNGDWATPYKHLQKANGTSGALRNATSAGTTGATPPGTQIVLLGGDYTPVGDYHLATITGNAGRWANLLRVSGLPNAPISITSYPGDVGANANQIAVFRGDTFANSAGGFLGPDNARANETNGWDSSITGWGKSIYFSWLKVIANPNAVTSDGAPFNINSGMDDCRIFACEGMWQSNTPAPNGARGGGWCGNGKRVRTLFNWWHDLTNGDNLDQNHGIYPDTSDYTWTDDCTIAFTAITNITGGSHISINVSGNWAINNVIIYNCWLDGCNKSNLAFNDAGSAYIFNTPMQKAGGAAINIANGSQMNPNGVQVFHCDIFDWDQLNQGRGAFWDQGSDGSGNWIAQNNSIMRRSSALSTSSNALGWTTINFPLTAHLEHNTWYDAKGLLPTVIYDSGNGGQYALPGFVNSGYGTQNFKLQATSAMLGFSSADRPEIPRDFDFLLAAAGSDGGAYERP